MWPPPSQVRGRPMRRYAPWPESSRNIAPAARRRAAVCRWHAFDSSPEGCRSPCPTDISIQIRRYDQTLVARSNSPDRDSVFLWRSALLPPVVSFVSRTITGHTAFSHPRMGLGIRLGLVWSLFFNFCFVVNFLGANKGGAGQRLGLGWFW